MDLARRDVDAHDGQVHGQRADAAGCFMAPLHVERRPGQRGDLAQGAAPIGEATDHRGAVVEHDVVRARFEVPGRERHDLLAKPRGRVMHGVAGHHRRAARGAAHAVGHEARITQMHGDVCRRDLKDVGAHLGKCGGQALSDRRRARGEDDHPLRGQRHPSALERADARRLHDGGEPDAKSHVAAGRVQLATRGESCIVLAGLQRLLEHRAEVLAREVGLAPDGRRGHRVHGVRAIVG